MATDFNSGLLVLVLTLAVWPRVGIKQAESARARYAREVRESQEKGSAQHA